MVLAGKIFDLRENLSLSAIASKLKDYRREEPFDEEAVHVKLLTEIHSLTIKEKRLEGVFSQDVILYVFHHGERTPTPRTIETTFTFVEYKERVLLVVLERKFLANNIANRLSEAIFVTLGYITEAHIPPETLKTYHERNPEDTKIIFFDDVNIPNINKLSLYGSSLINTALYNQYCSYGKIWYIVVTSRRYENIVGITRNAVITVFNRIEKADFLNYVIDEVFPLIQ